MKVELIRIGNSQGIRIPKAIIEQCGLANTVELRVHDGALIIEKSQNVRSGWGEAFATMHKNQDDHLIISEPFIENEWDGSEWTW
ncbi:MAG: AbrB/MazE/SpoVT family DNA-binding domain-containing protein [Candidatus Obscuribacterales bacterium]|jgi:antitoxin MazE